MPSARCGAGCRGWSFLCPGHRRGGVRVLEVPSLSLGPRHPDAATAVCNRLRCFRGEDRSDATRSGAVSRPPRSWARARAACRVSPPASVPLALVAPWGGHVPVSLARTLQPVEKHRLLWTVVLPVLGESPSLFCVELAGFCNSLPFRMEQAGRVTSTFPALGGRALVRLGHSGGLIWNSGYSSLSFLG